MFRVVFVLDIFNGVVLHATGGNRQNYQPVHIKSKICNTSDPLEILTQLKPRETYVADLNRLQKTGTDNHDLIKKISENTLVMADTGIETLEDIQACLAVAKRAVLGTETATLDTILKGAEKYPEKLNVSIDIKNGSILTSDERLSNPTELIRILNEVEIDTIIVLDLDRVGSNSGINTSLLEELCTRSDHSLLAGGGVRDLNDLETLKDLGVHGALVSTAIHSGSLPPEILR
jgi:phosphoribosylformimino-5-aminoimidazole carboxamide ribotide isomerase